jgi:hypothetical protein
LKFAIVLCPSLQLLAWRLRQLFCHPYLREEKNIAHFGVKDI